MSQKATYFSDVTLASNDSGSKSSQPICKFNQRGFCKFGQKCRKMHIDTICKNVNCSLNICLNRHPKPCKYYLLNGSCRFKEKCGFTHVKSDVYLKVEKLENEIKQLNIETDLLKAKLLENENKLLKKEVEELKIIVLENKNKLEDMNTCNNAIKCDICEYEASSATVLRSHKTRKHKPETLRESNVDVSLLVTPHHEHRYDEYSEVNDSEEQFKDYIVKKTNIYNPSNNLYQCMDCDL